MKNERQDGLTRREALVAGIAGAGAAVLAAAGNAVAGGSSAAPSPAATPGSHGQGGKDALRRMPVVFLPHGGGPWPFVETGIGTQAEQDAMAGYLRSIAEVAGRRPAAILCVSAHWEEPEPTVMTSPRPPMLYDYSGFPPESYRITWPAPGSPALAARVRALLGAAGLKSGEDRARGFDHGAFVPLKVAFPGAELPTVQLSLRAGLDPAEHLAIGKALAPLRDEGVLIVGSGMTFHNLRGFFQPGAAPVAAAFDAWLREAGTAEPAARDAALVRWEEAPAARLCHPREEHLLPLMVVAGAAGADRGRVAWRGTIADLELSAYHFG
ncbi:MAG: class III extradiol ring-cleavage dioxygenase [Anaeromyxobacteraceae bacterium]